MALLKPFRPMLAASLCKPSDTQDVIDDIFNNLILPVLATPKLDGIRCCTVDKPSFPHSISLAVCRSLKPVPNDHIRKQIEKMPPGFDGEIMTYPPPDLFNNILEHPRNFYECQSDVMSFTGTPTFRFHIFDMGFERISVPYVERVEMLKHAVLPDFCVRVLPKTCYDRKDLETFMADCLQQGHEGICFRTPHSRYKYGRSTMREQWLVKWKMFETAEAEVVGFDEANQNQNDGQIDERGYLKRSNHKKNMVGKGCLGALFCKTPDGVTFGIGTGFSQDQRYLLWEERASLIGRLVTYKCQGHGTKTAPRIPVFIGFRDRRDT